MRPRKHGHEKGPNVAMRTDAEVDTVSGMETTKAPLTDRTVTEFFRERGGVASVAELAMFYHADEGRVRRWARDNDVRRLGATFCFSKDRALEMLEDFVLEDEKASEQDGGMSDERTLDTRPSRPFTSREAASVYGLILGCLVGHPSQVADLRAGAAQAAEWHRLSKAGDNGPARVNPGASTFALTSAVYLQNILQGLEGMCEAGAVDAMVRFWERDDVWEGFEKGLELVAAQKAPPS